MLTRIVFISFILLALPNVGFSQETPSPYARIAISAFGASGFSFFSDGVNATELDRENLYRLNKGLNPSWGLGASYLIGKRLVPGVQFIRLYGSSRVDGVLLPTPDTYPSVIETYHQAHFLYRIKGSILRLDLKFYPSKPSDPLANGFFLSGFFQYGWYRGQGLDSVITFPAYHSANRDIILPSKVDPRFGMGQIGASLGYTVRLTPTVRLDFSGESVMPVDPGLIISSGPPLPEHPNLLRSNTHTFIYHSRFSAALLNIVSLRIGLTCYLGGLFER
jgi:hypothetical protein